MSPVATNQMVNGSLDLNEWKSWADRGSSLLVSRSLCFPQCLATRVPALGRHPGQEATICYSPVKASGKGPWVLVSGLCYVSQLGGLCLVAVRELCGVQSVRFSPLGSSQPVLRVLVSAFTPFPPWLLSALSVVSGYAEQLLYASAWAFSKMATGH